MRTMTESQFIEFCKTAKWETSQDCEINDYELNDGYTDDGDQITKKRATAYCWKTAKFDGIEVTYQDECSWDGTSTERYGDFEVEPSSNEQWGLEGLVITYEDGDDVDDEGQTLSAAAQGGILGDVNQINHELLIPTVTITEVDTQENAMEATPEEMEETTVYRDNEPNLRFTGVKLAVASDKDSRSTRWFVLRLYKTKGGKYVCSRIGKTLWDGEVDRYSGAVCANASEVIAFFGHSDLAKELYSDAGIEDIEDIE